MKSHFIAIVGILLLAGCVPTPKPVTWVGQPKAEWIGQTEIKWINLPELEWPKQAEWIGVEKLLRSEVACHPSRVVKLSDCPGCLHVIPNPRNESDTCGISLMCCGDGGACWTSTFVSLGPGEEIASFACGPRYDEVWMKCFYEGEDPTCNLSFLDF